MTELAAPAASRSRRARIPRGFPIASAAVLGAVVVCALFGPYLTPYPPEAIALRDAMTPPFWLEGGSVSHFLGTDNLGRDILSRIIAGARVSVTVALYAIVLSGGVGALLGMTAGYFGGFTDALISRLIDIQPPQVSWGGMLADGRNFIEVAWWLITMPGLAIMAACLASNLMGDWLRDTFDPKRRQL